MLRETMLLPKLEADFEMGDLSIQFYAADELVLHCVNGEVRGNGDPIPVLASLCQGRGWSVIDASDSSIVNLASASESAGWERFRKWRDQALLKGAARGQLITNE